MEYKMVEKGTESGIRNQTTLLFKDMQKRNELKF